MPVYVIYDRKTGEPVLTHFTPESIKTTRRDLLALVDPSFDHDNLEVTLVDPDALREGQTFRVDPQTGAQATLRQADAAGFGLGTGLLLNQERPERPLQIVYETAPSATDE